MIVVLITFCFGQTAVFSLPCFGANAHQRRQRTDVALKRQKVLGFSTVKVEETKSGQKNFCSKTPGYTVNGNTWVPAICMIVVTSLIVFVSPLAWSSYRRCAPLLQQHQWGYHHSH